MKKKMIFGAVVLALFVLQAQAVFAQSDTTLYFRVAGGYLSTDGRNFTDFGGSGAFAAINVEPGNMMIVLTFRDGSDLTYQFRSGSQRNGGGWVFENGRRLTSGGNLVGNYHGEMIPVIVAGYRMYDIKIYADGQGQGLPELMLNVTGL